MNPSAFAKGERVRVHDDVESLRIEPAEGGGWTLHLDGETLGIDVHLTNELAEELDRSLVEYRSWRAEGEAVRLSYRRHVAGGGCPVWVVAEYDGGVNGPCVLARDHQGEHRTDADAADEAS